jgi:hypothetical protein
MNEDERRGVVTPDAASNRCNVIWSTSPMADNSLLPLSGDEKLALVAALKRSIDEDRYPLSPRVRPPHSR